MYNLIQAYILYKLSQHLYWHYCDLFLILDQVILFHHQVDLTTEELNGN